MATAKRLAEQFDRAEVGERALVLALQHPRLLALQETEGQQQLVGGLPADADLLGAVILEGGVPPTLELAGIGNSGQRFAEFDDELMESYLEDEDSVTPEMIRRALRASSPRSRCCGRSSSRGRRSRTPRPASRSFLSA